MESCGLYMHILSEKYATWLVTVQIVSSFLRYAELIIQHLYGRHDLL
jgi:hypothetical protein